MSVYATLREMKRQGEPDIWKLHRRKICFLYFLRKLDEENQDAGEGDKRGRQGTVGCVGETHIHPVGRGLSVGTSASGSWLPCVGSAIKNKRKHKMLHVK
jgi:hypothetical protein